MDNSGFNIVISDEDDEKMVGFRLTFKNGYTISVIFGENTKSDHPDLIEYEKTKEYFSKTAEVAVLNDKNEFVPFKNDGTIKSHVKSEELPQIISWTINRWPKN